jgi:hypothetical protein
MARFGRLEIDPARCPAVLDTTTWDPGAALGQVRAAGSRFWHDALRGRSAAVAGAPVVHEGSRAPWRGREVVLATLPDGQDVFLAFGEDPLPDALGRPLGNLAVEGIGRLAVHPADAPTLARYLRLVNPRKAPRPLGCVPRLGIGDRHSVAVWPAAWRAMERGGFAANAIQNSVRELALLDDLRAGRPARVNHLPGFGDVPEGHTGSTFEGLFHAGVLSALRSPTFPRYGADADHIQVKRGPGGLDRARLVVEASRHYTFFTLDVSDLLDYGAMRAAGTVARELGPAALGAAAWRDALRYHRGAWGPRDARVELDEAAVGRLAAAYGRALDAVEALVAHVRRVKGGEAFDLELSIDETPPGTAAADGITPPEAVVFLCAEIERRGLPVTHLAPNFGVEKGVDYRCPGGLPALEERVRAISRIARERHLALDCHSGDDLGRATRRAFGRATGGNINFKISPLPQQLLAETLFDTQRDLFDFWWRDARESAVAEAARGSEAAARCLADPSAADARPDTPLFHAFAFLSVGRRDPAGRFVNRERLYGLSDTTLAEYGRRLERLLLEIAEDLFGGA